MLHIRILFSVECLLYNYHTLLQPLFLQCKKKQTMAAQRRVFIAALLRSLCVKSANAAASQDQDSSVVFHLLEK